MKNRYLICIAGSFTAGKSSLAKMFADGAFNNNIHFIPHTTCRSPRQDDNPHLVNVVPPDVFEKSAFFTRDDNYGTLQSHIDDFLASDSQIGLSIVSCYELPEIRKKMAANAAYAGLRLLTVLIRLEDSMEAEVVTLKRRLPAFYPADVAAKRIQWNVMFCEECFFNTEYLIKNIDVILSQSTGDLVDWCLKLQAHLPILRPVGKLEISRIAALANDFSEVRTLKYAKRAAT